MGRRAELHRKTAETDITVAIDLDEAGSRQTGEVSEIATSIPFLDHMLTLFARHGFFILKISGKGDTHIDYHHLVEDIGICLGEVVKKALGEKKGISRYGSAFVPMDETLCHTALDLSGRPYLIFNATFDQKKIGDFDPNLLLEFFKAFSDNAGMTLHVNLMYGNNNHHKAEAIFKSFAKALSQAVSMDHRVEGVLSTKEML